MIPITKFNNDPNPTLEILGKEYTLGEVIKLRSAIFNTSEVFDLYIFLTGEINRIQQPVFDRLHSKGSNNHGGMNS